MMGKRKFVGAAAFTLVALSLAGCAQASGSRHGNAAPKPTTRAVATHSSAAQSCAQQMDSWKARGIADLKDVSSDLQKLNKDSQQVETDMENGQPPGSDGTTLAGDIGAMLGDVYRIKLKDMPPACVPHLDGDYQTVTSDLANVGSSYTLFLGAASQDNMINATADLDVAATNLQNAATAFRTANTDFTNYYTATSAP